MITPLRDYVVLEEVNKGEKILDSGLVLTGREDTPESPRAKILAKGSEVSKDIQVDQIVLFKPHMFDQFYPEIDGKVRYLIGKEEAIIAIL